MHGRRPEDHRPSHRHNAVTEHVDTWGEGEMRVGCGEGCTHIEEVQRGGV